MFSKYLPKATATLSFRLVLWYLAIYTASCVFAFAVCYALIASHLREATDEELFEELHELSELYQSAGLSGIREELRNEADEEDLRGKYFVVYDESGAIKTSTDLLTWNSFLPFLEYSERVNLGDEAVLETRSFANKTHPVRSISGKVVTGVIIEIGMSVVHEVELLDIFRRIFALVFAVMTVFAAAVGWFMSRRALKGIEEVTEIAVDIKKGALKERVPLKNRGLEVETLARTFNSMLDHIEALVREMRQLTDNIAHDIKNPITSIRGRAELALTSPKSRAELETVMAATVEDSDRLLHMINNMLDLAEADSGALRLKHERIDVRALVLSAVEIFESMAEDKGIRIAAEIPDVIHVLADRQELQRMVANLLDNAVKYTPRGGKITISASNAIQAVEIAIADTGIGISEDELPKVFKRYYRSDQSRSAKGNGLGLSLARAIARAHRGDILVSSSPQAGSKFTILLPNLA